MDIAILLLLWGIVRRRRGFQIAGVVVLLVSSNPWVGRSLFRYVEGSAERIAAPTAPTVDAIVVLSAGRIRAPGPAAVSEWADANRFFGGIELFQAGKAPLLVFTGGWLPWEGDVQTEGSLLAAEARALGVAAANIRVTGRVSNTADEAREVGALLRNESHAPSRILLVTSAFHMARASRLFQQAGMSVTPFPVDFALSEGGRLPGANLMPSVGALELTQAALREIYGRVYYRLRGGS